MVFNVSVQYSGGFLPETILFTLCDNIGEPCQYHVPVEFLSLQPMFPPKPFHCSGGLAEFRFFFKNDAPCRLEARFARNNLYSTFYCNNYCSSLQVFFVMA